MIASEWLVTPQGTERIKYSYDTLGNITEVNENGKPIVFYTYDALNRLVREDNKKWGKTITYDYDPSGNIVSKAEYAFTRANLDELTPIKEHNCYNDVDMRDQLNSFDGEVCVYDVIGNPTTYRNNILKWGKVRQLEKYGNNISFTYNAAGTRLGKTVTLPPTETTAEAINTTKYYYDGATLLAEKLGENYKYFNYGIGGLSSFTYLNKTYLYKKNIMGDILGLFDANSDKEIVQYVYDAYGNHKIFVLNSGNYIDISREKEYTIDSIYEQYKELALANPFRYRGYYYDQETGLYYLMSRYYDPETGRFINADDISYLDPETVGGLNLYAYCGGNPVMRVDPSGREWWDWLTAIGSFLLVGLAIVGVVALAGITSGLGAVALMSVAVGMGVGSVTGGVSAAINGTSIAGGVLGGAIKGGAVGAAVGLGIMAGGGAFTAIGGLGAFAGAVGINFAAGMIHYGIDNASNGRTTNWRDAFASGGMQALSGAFAFGAGAINGVAGFYNVPKVTKMLSSKWIGNFAASQFIKALTYYPFSFLFSYLQKSFFNGGL